MVLAAISFTEPSKSRDDDATRCAISGGLHRGLDRWHVTSCKLGASNNIMGAPLQGLMVTRRALSLVLCRLADLAGLRLWPMLTTLTGTLHRHVACSSAAIVGSGGDRA
jgi:hypothetical protein